MYDRLFENSLLIIRDFYIRGYSFRYNGLDPSYKNVDAYLC